MFKNIKTVGILVLGIATLLVVGFPSVDAQISPPRGNNIAPVFYRLTYPI